MTQHLTDLFVDFNKWSLCLLLIFPPHNRLYTHVRQTLHMCNPCHNMRFPFHHAGSPSVTSLTYDDESRTLTCISTGGPATIVSWRRNGVVITLSAAYQQTKTLVDPVTGTYQTVLTINPSLHYSRVVGNYNCTVENARGESSETVVVTGKTPLQVRDSGCPVVIAQW